MRLNDFDIYKDLLREKCGLYLSQDKSYLLDSRLTPVAKKWNYTSVETLTMALAGVPEPALVKDVVEAMVDPDTAFFRDGAPFDAFRDTVLPWLLAERKKTKKFRIWSAGCSTGQEPFSLAMILDEKAEKLHGWNADMMATDISSAALEYARRGVFQKFEVQRGLPVKMLVKYFDQIGSEWVLKQDIADRVKFRYFNLLDDMKQLGQVEVVFCRNVIDNFTRTMRADTLKKLGAIIPVGGFLFLGAEEDLGEEPGSFTALDGVPGGYRRI